MNSFTIFTLIAQSVLTLYFMITHWIPLYPWNDLNKSSFAYEKPLNAFMHCIQIALLYGFAFQINWLMTLGIIFWSVWLYGYIRAWLIPYLYGASPQEMRDYQQTFGNTYKFLPRYKDHPIPDACHTILGLLTAFVVPSVYAAYFFDGHAITLCSTLFGIVSGIAIIGFFAAIMKVASHSS